MQKGLEAKNKLSRISEDSVKQILEKFGVSLSASLADQVIEYIELLLRWNEKISLTSIRNPLLIVDRHFGEAFFGAVCAEIDSGELLDVGSGAGFPALPLAMLRPGLSEILLEPNAKKAAFLGEASLLLELSHRMKVFRCRLEQYSSDEKFHFITSRAVRVTPQFLDRCLDFLRSGGKLILWLGHEDAKLVAANPKWVWSDPVRIPGSEQRFILSGTPRLP